ncbi:hypothetical protein EG68_01642 [Paragonimus skrjabini miyazakii]|uniref:Uncharacterized protein n=1 Tax=Paragonimus skrjabini miyazakii TaxID=59628 RepID=A0A8S9Z117_9TREM|nr:hypothetical protein EG68_01642 [Paragonimus skrjabini miyazakii]
MTFQESGLCYLDIMNFARKIPYGQFGHNKVHSNVTPTRTFDLSKFKLHSSSNDLLELTLHNFSEALIQKKVAQAKWSQAVHMTMGVQRVYSKIARKHYKCVVEAINKKCWVKALVHIEQCLRLVTTNNRWYVERAEINLKLSRFHSAIADFLYVLSQPVHNYATRRSVCFPTVSTDPEDGVTSNQERRSDTLRLIHSYIQFGRYLLKLRQFTQSEAQFVEAKRWIDQYCCEKTDSPTQTSFLSTELTAASPGEMLTLQDILRLYEAQDRVEDYMNLLTKSIRQSRPSVTRRIREVMHKTHEDHPEIEILSRFHRQFHRHVRGQS